MTEVPAGLILLVGPPASGKSSFARAWVRGGRIDPDGVVSADAIRVEFFGAAIRVEDDPAVFDEVDSRVAARLAAGLAVVVDATNVTAPARAGLLAWARQYGRPSTALRFVVDVDALVRRNAARPGNGPVTSAAVRKFAVIAAAQASRERLLGEGIDLVVDVPGEAEGAGPSDAAELIFLSD
jgi:predicted kinase